MVVNKPAWFQHVRIIRGPPPFVKSSFSDPLGIRTQGSYEPGRSLEEKQLEEEDEAEADTVLSLDIGCSEKWQDDALLVCVLKACANRKDIHKGSSVHAHILKWDLLKRNTFVGNTLVNLYAKCGAIAKAKQVFDAVVNRNLVTWTALVTGYTQHGLGKEALKCLEHMHEEGCFPDAAAFASVLKACGGQGTPGKGMEIHAKMVKHGLPGNNVVLGSALVDMYAKHGALARAHNVLDELPVWNVVSWNALITGYCQHGYGAKALHCFELMQQEGVCPDAVTFSCVLTACGCVGAAGKGKEIHVEIVRKGLLQNDAVLGNTLVDMYAKCGVVSVAQCVLDELSAWSVVSWTALIVGYCRIRLGDKALCCYDQMISQGLFLDAVTLACILKACGSIGASEFGKEIHGELIRKGLLEKDTVLGNALIDMYAKCGLIGNAEQVFEKLQLRDTVSYNALMVGCCEQGQSIKALLRFEEMKHENFLPDDITFLCVLKACTSSSAVDKGRMYFEMMSASYGIIPSVEHQTYMVGLFGCAGHLDKAMAMIKKMPCPDHVPMWFSLLVACSRWGNMKLGNLAFGKAVNLGPIRP